MIPEAYIEDDIDERDWWFGAGKTLGDVVRDNGDWRLYLPKFETQRKNGLETFSCTNFTTLNNLEILLEQKYGLESDFSERHNAKLSGTTKIGNSPHFAAQAVRHYGVINEDLLPFSPDIISLDDFYAEISKNLLAHGYRWLAKWVFNHQWVPTTRGAILDALRFSPLGVSVYAWVERNGIYYKPDGVRDTHLTTLVAGDNNFWYVFDSYPPYIKRLEKEYTFERIKRYHVARQSESAFRARMRQFMDSLRGWIKIR